jgi:hypothetical protein
MDAIWTVYPTIAISLYHQGVLGFLPFEKRSADGAKTFSTGIAGFVHPGGGSFWALTHDATTKIQLIHNYY